MENGEKLENHEVRIKDLEKNRQQQEIRFLQLESKVDNLKQGMLEVKNTVLEEGRDRKKESEVLLAHVLDNDTYSRKHKRNIEMRRQDYLWRWFVRATAVGGIIYLLIDVILKKLLGGF